jgi:hypothetical protein
MGKYDYYEGGEKEENENAPFSSLPEELEDIEFQWCPGGTVFTFCCYARKPRIDCTKLRTGYVCETCYIKNQWKVILDNHEKTREIFRETKLLTLQDLISMEEAKRGPAISLSEQRRQRQIRRQLKNKARAESAPCSKKVSRRVPNAGFSVPCKKFVFPAVNARRRGALLSRI